MTATTETSIRVSPATAPAARHEPGLLPVATLILWAVCLLVGGIGLVRAYPRPQAKPPEQVIVAQKLVVDLAPEVVQPTDPAPPPPDPLAPPPLPAALTAPAAPALIAVAEPSPAVAFALPVEGPTRVVEAKQAAFARPAGSAPASTPAPQKLVFGEGEGKQPAPLYPRLARLRGQAGTVGVRFTVGEDGRVLAAEAVLPSPWPVLNDSALKTIREQWQYPPGSVRVFEIPIEFDLKKK